MERQDFITYMASMVGIALADFYTPLAPWLLLGLVLIVSDLRFGVLAARKRGETIRHSRMMRRTIAKAFDYLCWVTVAGLCTKSFGNLMGVPIVSMGILMVIYGIEISSCVNNYFEYKGVGKKFNFWKLLKKTDLEEAFEDEKD